MIYVERNRVAPPKILLSPRAAKAKKDAGLQDSFLEEIEEKQKRLIAFQEPKSEFAALARQEVPRFIRSLDPRFVAPAETSP